MTGRFGAAGFGYAAAVLLAALFVVAAVAKLRSPAATARSFGALGLPAADALARLVPAVEVVVAVALVVRPPVGAVAALTTLAFFTTFVVTRLRAGVEAPCSCFGSTRREPLSVANLVQNAALLLLAAAALPAAEPVRPAPAELLALAAFAGFALAVHRSVRRRRVPGG